MNNDNTNRSLPSHLNAAYAWTNSAAELTLLASLNDGELDAYVADSAANAIDSEVLDVLADDLYELAMWLRSA